MTILTGIIKESLNTLSSPLGQNPLSFKISARAHQNFRAEVDGKHKNILPPPNVRGLATNPEPQTC